MDTLPAPIRPELPPLARLGDFNLVDAFLAGRKPTTLDAYRRDLIDFSKFLGQTSAGAAVELLVSGTAGQANTIALGYKAHLIGRKLAPATVSRRLAALRSMVRLARTLGRITWHLEIEGPRSEPYRDTCGPGDAGWRTILDLVKADASVGTALGLRNLAIVRCLHDLGLRRGELVSLDRADVDAEEGTVRIIGKGRSDRERLTLPPPVRRDLAAWLAVHPDPRAESPLLVRLDHPGRGRLSADAVHKLIGVLGRRAGLVRGLRPHGLRHQAITSVLDRNGGDVRAAAKFSRHKDLRTLSRYDDNRRDLAGSMARLISED